MYFSFKTSLTPFSFFDKKLASTQIKLYKGNLFQEGLRWKTVPGTLPHLKYISIILPVILTTTPFEDHSFL